MNNIATIEVIELARVHGGLPPGQPAAARSFGQASNAPRSFTISAADLQAALKNPADFARVVGDMKAAGFAAP